MEHLRCTGVDCVSAKCVEHGAANAMQRVLYYGVAAGQDGGHFLYLREGGDYIGHRKSVDGLPFLPTEFDGGFAPQDTREQGKALCVWERGWTMIGFHDYTADSRPGSNSCFILKGVLDVDYALAFAKERWPLIFRRLEKAGVKVVPWKTEHRV